MAVVSKTVASLRLFGDDLNPEEITALLGSAPTKSRQKGDVRFSSSGRETISKTGSWILSAADRSPGDLNGQIQELLSQLSPDLSVWKGLSQRYRCDIFCGLFMQESNEGEDLQARTIAMVGDRGLSLGFDIYDSTPD